MDHISEDELDRYAARSMAEAEAAAIEEHLLTCAFCQDRLELTDEFVAAMRAAVHERNAKNRRRRTAGR